MAGGETRFGAQLLVTTKGYTGPSERVARQLAATVITICTHRKRVRPSALATAVALPFGSQDTVQSAWLEKLRTLPADVPASALYAGRGFGIAVQAATIAKAKLHILSAGLGLVAATQRVPGYGLTVSDGRAESVAARVTGEFDVTAWFSALLSGPYSEQWADVVGHGSGRILLALTRPYAKMVGKSLCELHPSILARLRIFGASLSPALPATLRQALAPYDERLDTIIPGTRTDFSQRALLHFVKSVITQNTTQDRDADYAGVEAALEESVAPERVRRPRRTDEEILKLILARLPSQSGIARILRVLRDEEGVACEQSRFSRLYQAAVEQRAAA